MTITHLPASEHIPVPWKNGGGVTREVAVFPSGAGMEDFDWRISMAEVTKAGPFSQFEGIRRHLTVLRGRLQLDLPDRRYTLGPLNSLEFDGDLPVFGTPLEPVLDLNVMTHTGKVSTIVRQVGSDTFTEASIAILVDPVSLDAWRIDGGGQTPCAGLLIEFA